MQDPFSKQTQNKSRKRQQEKVDYPLFKSPYYFMTNEYFPNKTFREIDIKIRTAKPLFDFILIHRSNSLPQTIFNKNYCHISYIKQGVLIENIPILYQQRNTLERQQFEITFSLSKNIKQETIMSNFRLTTFNFLQILKGIISLNAQITLSFEEFQCNKESKVSKVFGILSYIGEDGNPIEKKFSLYDKVKGVQQLRQELRRQYQQKRREFDDQIQRMGAGFEQNQIKNYVRQIYDQLYNSKNIQQSNSYFIHHFESLRNYFIRQSLVHKENSKQNKYSDDKIIEITQQSLRYSFSGLIYSPPNKIQDISTNNLQRIKPELDEQANVFYKFCISEIIQEDLKQLALESKRSSKPVIASIFSQTSGILQGKLGTCYQISSIDQIITQTPQFLRKVCVINYDDPTTYALSLLNVDGDERRIIGDKRLPIEQITQSYMIGAIEANKKKKLQLAYLNYEKHSILKQFKKQNIQRALIIIDALDQSYTKHKYLEDGYAYQIFMNITNSTTQSLILQKDKVELITKFNQWRNNTKSQTKVLITFNFQINQLGQEKQESIKQFFESVRSQLSLKDQRHEYSFYGYFEIKSGVRLVRIRDPLQNNGLKWMKKWMVKYDQLYKQWLQLKQHPLDNNQFLIDFSWLAKIQTQTYVSICQTNPKFKINRYHTPIAKGRITQLKIKVDYEQSYQIVVHRYNKRSFYQLSQERIQSIKNNYKYSLISLKLMRENWPDQTLQNVIDQGMYTHLKCKLQPNITYILEISEQPYPYDENIQGYDLFQQLYNQFYRSVISSKQSLETKYYYCTITGLYNATLLLKQSPILHQEHYKYYHDEYVKNNNTKFDNRVGPKRQVRYVIRPVNSAGIISINIKLSDEIMNKYGVKPQKLLDIVVVELRDTKPGFTGRKNRFEGYEIQKEDEDLYLIKVKHKFDPSYGYKLSITAKNPKDMFWKQTQFVKLKILLRTILIIETKCIIILAEYIILLVPFNIFCLNYFIKVMAVDIN